ncbi:MAG: Crp/Fnr family transcriptional regulator, partial [Actinomycetes bacterium]
PLDRADRTQLVEQARRRSFGRGEVIFHEGDPADTVHLIVSGHVFIRITTPQGDVATVRVVGPGGHFGELALVAPGARLATVRAVERAETLVIGADAFSGLRRRNPEIERAMTAMMTSEVRRLSHQLVEALYLPVPKRIRRRLMDLHTMYAVDGERVTLPVTQEDIAGLAGTTRPTTNKELMSLQDAGLIVVGRGRIEVLNPTELSRRAR